MLITPPPPREGENKRGGEGFNPYYARFEKK